MPRLDTLTARQIDGEACVWCAVRPRSPIPIGPRISTDNGGLRRWSPIAHPRCAAQQAGRVYRLHVKTCQRCVPQLYCPDSRALHTLATTGTTRRRTMESRR